MTDKIYLDKEFNKIWNKIGNNENFALLRYGDGERAIMVGRSVKAQEGWVSPKGISAFGLRLFETLNFNDDNIYYGISCPCCDNEAYYWYSSRIRSKNITFANLFVNANYQKFVKKFEKLNRDAIFIGNYRAENKHIGKLNIVKYYFVDDDCFTFFENNYNSFINKIKNEYGAKNNLLYVISAGTLSEIIIADLYKNNPNNCYIDFGSSIDKYIHEKQTRPYMDKKTVYARQKCVMYNPETTNFDVTVVLSAYKRVENLKLQINAIENQSLKPKEILLFQDGLEGDEKILIPEDIKQKFNIVEISPNNMGVWARFDFARRVVKSKYVCIFDDDTIPGYRWLENCLTQMHKQEGLYGTIGILCNQNAYKSGSFTRIGWDNPNNKTAQVDFVGHSWFLKKEWLDYLFESTEEMQNYKICGEDMTLSFKLQEKGINTFVPPHPKNNRELWGSLPEYSHKFGNDENSLFVNNGWNKMSEVFDLLINKYGFKILKYNNYKSYQKALKFQNRKESILKKIFSIRNEYNGDIKRKIITILGIKFKINTAKNISAFIKYKPKLRIDIQKNLVFPVFENYDVSIIIPVYNQYEYTLKCLNSIYQNTDKVRYEIILVDDASKDETINIENRIKNIKIIRNSKNLGYVRSCNIGINHAEGKYVYLLNNDTFIMKNTIKKLLDTYNKENRVGIVGPKIINPKTFLLQSAGAQIKHNGENYSIGYNKSPLDKRFNKLQDVQYVCGASLMISKKLLDKLNGLDEIYSPGYYEETDLCFKVREAGYRVIYQPLSEIFHYGSMTFGECKNLNIICQRNCKIFLNKWANKINSEQNYDI